MNIKIEFELESIVYHKLSPDEPGIVTGILVRPGNSLLYCVTWDNSNEGRHLQCELTAEKSYTHKMP